MKSALTSQQSKLLEGYLSIWEAFGVSDFVNDEKFDYFAQTQASTPQSTPQKSPPNVQSVQREQGLAASQSARDGAQNAKTLDELRTFMESFTGCALKRSAKNMVFGAGHPQARLVIVGEFPDRDEDAQGVPFAGSAGALLDKMLAAIGLSRENVFLTNMIPWRTPGNRAPTPEEVDICLPFCQRQIELVSPKVVLAMGALSAQTLTQQSEGLLKLRGKVIEGKIGHHATIILPTLNPAFLLRQPLQKRQAWEDLKMLKTLLESTK